MKLILVTLLLFSSTLVKSSELDKSDYKKIKAMVMKHSSKAMVKSKKIAWALDERDFTSIVVSSDIIDKEDLISVKAEVMPGEENCKCQDVFNVTMTATKSNNYWSLNKDSLKVEHVRIDH